jgi:hypothetical protein
MSPLSGASVSDLYGDSFGLNAEQITKKTLENNEILAKKNEMYQNNLKEKNIAGRADFKETYPNNTFGNFNGTNIGPRTNPGNNEKNIRTTTFPPDVPPYTENDSRFSKRLAWSNANNSWPSNQGFSMFNRFQDIFGTRENFGSTAPLSDAECLKYLVSLVKEVILVLKIIMVVLILLFVIKVLEKKN